VVLEPVCCLVRPIWLRRRLERRCSSLQPALRVSNVSRSGPVGVITYDFEVSLSDTFTNLAAYRSGGEQPSTTEITVGPLESGPHIFLACPAHAMARSTVHGLCRAQFLTPAAVCDTTTTAVWGVVCLHRIQVLGRA
jgi:hypothetical protein